MSTFGSQKKMQIDMQVPSDQLLNKLFSDETCMSTFGSQKKMQIDMQVPSDQLLNKLFSDELLGGYCARLLWEKRKLDFVG